MQLQSQSVQSAGPVSTPAEDLRAVNPVWEIAAQTGTIRLNERDPATQLLRDLIDTPWCQRMRSVRQLGNARLVYPSGEHSRFGHSFETATTAIQAIDDLVRNSGPTLRKQIEEYRVPVVAAALCHDWGHVAPGSHLAYRSIFKGHRDAHEAIGARILNEDQQVNAVLRRYGSDVPELVRAILDEGTNIPPWTWQLISGGGWNVDRGTWTYIDSVMCGIQDGTYNIPAILGSLTVLDDGSLAFREKGIASLSRFAIARAQLYEIVYYHRVILGADAICSAAADRAKELFTAGKLCFADEVMQAAFQTTDPAGLPLDQIFQMREAWWEYHVMRWRHDPDQILADLSARLGDRGLLKMSALAVDFPLSEVIRQQVEAKAAELGFDPHYYVHEIQRRNVTAGDFKKDIHIVLESGATRKLSEYNSFFRALAAAPSGEDKRWLIMPGEVKRALQLGNVIRGDEASAATA